MQTKLLRFVISQHPSNLQKWCGICFCNSVNNQQEQQKCLFSNSKKSLFQWIWHSQTVFLLIVQTKTKIKSLRWQNLLLSLLNSLLRLIHVLKYLIWANVSQSNFVKLRLIPQVMSNVPWWQKMSTWISNGMRLYKIHTRTETPKDQLILTSSW